MNYETWITDLSSALIGMLMSSFKLFLFSKEVYLNLGMRLILYCVVFIKHVAFFTIWAKLTVAFTCTSLTLNLYTPVYRCGCGFDLNNNFGGLTDLEEKRHGSADLHSPIPPPVISIKTLSVIFIIISSSFGGFFRTEALCDAYHKEHASH